MENPIERAKYQLPQPYFSGSERNPSVSSFELYREVQFIPLAEHLGFRRLDDITTKKGRWRVWERFNHAVPNFSAPETVTHSMLAVYKGKDMEPQAILRASSEPFNPKGFEEDLNAVAKYYVERPRILGFPSKFTGDQFGRDGRLLREMGLSMATILIGGAAGSVVAEYSSTRMAAVVGVGVVWTSRVIIDRICLALERYAREKITHLDQYIPSYYAGQFLYEEHEHVTTVSIQDDVYNQLKKEGAEITPDQFLKEIYRRIPGDLKWSRAEELGITSYKKPPGEKRPGDAVHRMVEKSRELFTAD